MKKEVIDNLQKKGWSEGEIKKVETILSMQDVHDKSGSKKDLNKVIYWIAMLLIAASHLAITVYLFPFMIVLGKYFSLVLIAIYGLMFGFLFNLIIPHFEELDRKYHHAAVIFIAVISVVNIAIAANILNFFETKLGLVETVNPFVISTLYIIAFVLPYLYFQLRYIYK